MSRQASTPERTETIFQLLAGDNLKAHLYIEIERNNAWVVNPDISETRGVKWDEDRRRYDYSNFSLTPVANEIEFEVINKNGKYSEGSNQPEEGSLDNNVRVRLTGGYRLPTAVQKTLNVPIGSASILYHTKLSSGTIIADSDNLSGAAEEHFNDLFATLYDAVLYDSALLTPAGYAIHMQDGFEDDNRNVKQVRLTANTDKIRAYWCEVEHLDSFEDIKLSTQWHSLGALADGESVFNVTTTGKRYFIVATVWDGIPWSDPAALENIDIVVDDFMEWPYRSVFYLDSPDADDPPTPQMPRIYCKGRDAYKKMLEKQLNVMNLSGKYLDEIIKDLCNQTGVKYSATSIADLSLFPARTLTTGLKKVTNGDEILSRIMDILNEDGIARYEIFLAYDATIDDNILFVQPRPTSYEAVTVFDFQKYKQLGKLRKNYDKLISRFTIYSEEKEVNEASLIATQLVTTPGNVTISWGTPNAFISYFFSGIGSLPEESTLVDMTPTSVTFNFTNPAPNVTVNVYGCAWTAGEPAYWGEYISHRNMLLNGGLDHRTLNELLVSSAEAKAVAKGFALDFGTPLYESTGLSYSRLNLMLENNDIAFVWSRSLIIDRLFYIVGISYKWDRAEKPGDSTGFKIQDTGRRFTDVGSFKWDDVEKYNIGYKWDQVFGVLATEDPNSYNHLVPLEAS